MLVINQHRRLLTERQLRGTIQNRAAVIIIIIIKCLRALTTMLSTFNSPLSQGPSPHSSSPCFASKQDFGLCPKALKLGDLRLSPKLCSIPICDACGPPHFENCLPFNWFKAVKQVVSQHLLETIKQLQLHETWVRTHTCGKIAFNLDGLEVKPTCQSLYTFLKRESLSANLL